MKFLFLGDIVGRSGRDAACAYLPKARKEHELDFAVVNVDNAAGGFGTTPDVCKEFFKAGADIVTGGNHIWDQQEVVPYLAQEKRLLRPQNFPDIAPGTGVGVVTSPSGLCLVVIHVQGQLFMHEQLACPFACVDAQLKTHKLGAGGTTIFVDFHAEATSEKMALGQHLDGRVSAVIGTHTHVPTHDARILSGGTAYQTDAGMCGDYDSVIGMEKSVPLRRFLTKIPKGPRMTPATGPATICGAIVETDDKTGLAKSITPVRLGGVFH